MLNERQRRFAELLVLGRRGSDAAREAGYTGSVQVLRVTASKLRANPEVKALIEEHTRARSPKPEARRAAFEPLPAPMPAAFAAPVAIPAPAPSVSAEADPSAPDASPLEVLRALMLNASVAPSTRASIAEKYQRMWQEQRAAEAAAEADSRASAPRQGAIVWVANARGPMPAEVVLEGLMRLDTEGRAWVIEQATARPPRTGSDPA